MFSIEQFSYRNDGGFESAFHLVDQLLSSAHQVIDSSEKFWRDLPYVFSSDPHDPTSLHSSEDFEYKTELETSMAYFLGRCQAMPHIDAAEITRELEREVMTAATLRQAGQSWYAGERPAGIERWSEPASPATWAKRFKMSWDTLKARINEGKIRAQRLSSKSYRIHIDDVPEA